MLYRPRFTPSCTTTSLVSDRRRDVLGTQIVLLSCTGGDVSCSVFCRVSVSFLCCLFKQRRSLPSAPTETSTFCLNLLVVLKFSLYHGPFLVVKCTLTLPLSSSPLLTLSIVSNRCFDHTVLTPVDAFCLDGSWSNHITYVT